MVPSSRRATSREKPIPRIENHRDRPEVPAALAGEVGSDRRVSATVNRPLLYVAVPGAQALSAWRPRWAAPTRSSATPSAPFSALRCWRWSSGPFWPSSRDGPSPGHSPAITTAARSIAQGAAPRFPHSGIPDIDGLVRALREMHDQLDQRFSELRRERAESAALVEAMVEGVIATDPRGRIVTANTAARRLLGYEPEEPLPSVEQLFRVKAAREVVDAVLRGATVLERELELDGQRVLLSARPLPQGGPLLVLHDVTELSRLETVRRDFVANVSHELKTPLTSISGYAETLVNDDLDLETTRRFLEVIMTNSHRMQRLVDDLLDLSRIESGGWQPAPESLDTAQVARESWALLAGRAGARRVQFETVIGPGADRVYADLDALRQVLSNLLDNALRYTPAGGRITLVADRENGGVILRVRDTGTGIPSEHLPRIFERFYRADPARSREEGGTGLGLAIVKHMVEAHDGRVSATSEVGKGTEITCWFPDPVET